MCLRRVYRTSRVVEVYMLVFRRRGRDNATKKLMVAVKFGKRRTRLVRQGRVAAWKGEDRVIRRQQCLEM